MLPVRRSLAPMEAKAVAEPPVGDGWQYEPKWDGFRCLVFRDGNRVDLRSKSGQSLERYFPDLVLAFTSLKAQRFVLDGEIVIPVAGRLSFDDLLQRIHPAASRVHKLAAEHPALFIAFDLLVDADSESLLKQPLSERRLQLQRFARRFFPRRSRLRVSPATTDLEIARGWFRATGGNLDGIVAKQLDLPYRAGLRDGMQKIKHRHTVDCVVGGFRYAEGKNLVGSLLLGLYDDAGLLQHVGFTSTFTADERKKIIGRVLPLIGGRGFTGKAPGGPSRWSTKRTSQWQPLRTKLVVEVTYDHFTGDRFRHGTKLIRWRPDKKPSSCTLDQITIAKGDTLKLLESPSANREKTMSRGRRS